MAWNDRTCYFSSGRMARCKLGQGNLCGVISRICDDSKRFISCLCSLLSLSRIHRKSPGLLGAGKVQWLLCGPLADRAKCAGGCRYRSQTLRFRGARVLIG